MIWCVAKITLVVRTNWRRTNRGWLCTPHLSFLISNRRLHSMTSPGLCSWELASDEAGMALSNLAILWGVWLISPTRQTEGGRLSTPVRHLVRGLYKWKRIRRITIAEKEVACEDRQLQKSELLSIINRKQFLHSVLKRAKHGPVSIFPAMPDSHSRERNRVHIRPSILWRMFFKSFKGKQRAPHAYSCSSRGSHLIMYSPLPVVFIMRRVWCWIYNTFLSH